MDVQTELYLEELADRVEETEAGALLGVPLTGCCYRIAI